MTAFFTAHLLAAQAALIPRFLNNPTEQVCSSFQLVPLLAYKVKKFTA